MNDEDDIPLLDDLIRDGRETATPGPDVDLLAESGDEEDMTIDLATHDLAAERPAPESEAPVEQPQAIGEDGELESLDPLTEDTSLQELIVEEQIRLILDKHMEAAYEEILQLIQHKIR